MSNTKNRILSHTNQQHEYRSLIKSIVQHDDIIETLSANVHNNLFDIFYQTKPDIVILSSNDYTQEFHDFITEYHKKSKILLFINNIIDNDSIVDFWNKTNVLCIGRKDLIKNISLFNNTSLIYDRLYDNNIFTHNESIRNNKIAVFLSGSDNENDTVLSNILYPSTNLPIVLFNSLTYKKSQNVGFITPYEACDILNSYKAIIDIDDQFLLESAACKIPNLVVSGDMRQNIESMVTKTCNYNISNCSYDFFTTNTLLPILAKDHQ